MEELIKKLKNLLDIETNRKGNDYCEVYDEDWKDVIELITKHDEALVENKNPNIKEIIKLFLEKNKFDGLFCDECSCENSNLFPCGEPDFFCKAGHKIKTECHSNR